MNKLGITEQDQKYLKFVADIGFQYCELIKSMPDDLKARLNGYLEKGYLTHKSTANSAHSYSCKILALMKGYTPEERKQYLKLKKEMKQKRMK